MGNPATTASSRSWRRALGQGSKKAALAVLFSAVLLIPRIRRLRRRPRLWNAIRLSAAAVGAWLVWRAAHTQAAWGSLVGGTILLALAVAMRPQPLTKSLDELARELEALAALNGGEFVPDSEGARAPGAKILVAAERLVVVDRSHRSLLEIPVRSIRRVASGPSSGDSSNAREGAPWRLEITWEAGRTQAAVFLFEGFFAEHLARVAENTLRSLMRKELPVLKG